MSKRPSHRQMRGVLRAQCRRPVGLHLVRPLVEATNAMDAQAEYDLTITVLRRVSDNRAAKRALATKPSNLPIRPRGHRSIIEKPGTCGGPAG